MGANGNYPPDKIAAAQSYHEHAALLKELALTVAQCWIQRKVQRQSRTGHTAVDTVVRRPPASGFGTLNLVSVGHVAQTGFCKLASVKYNTRNGGASLLPHRICTGRWMSDDIPVYLQLLSGPLMPKNERC